MKGIIYKAIRELEIEETVNDIVSTWESTTFLVLRYYKTERRTEVVETHGSAFSPNNGTRDFRDGKTSAVTNASVVDGDSQEIVANTTSPVGDENCSKDFKR